MSGKSGIQRRSVTGYGRNDIVADIGANIGLTALFFASRAQKVYAFEPSRSTYRILTENLLRNGITNVEAINCGLGELEEKKTVTFSQKNRSGGYVSDKIRPEIGHITEDIRIDTLDMFFADKDPAPKFMKIDVEGYELSVIRGGAAIHANAPTNRRARDEPFLSRCFAAHHSPGFS